MIECILKLPIHTDSLIRNCQDVKIIFPSAEDGEYWIALPDGNRTLIYCNNMSSTPLDFISLPAGPDTKFAVFYYGTQSGAGNTYYNKVGINLAVS